MFYVEKVVPKDSTSSDFFSEGGPDEKKLNLLQKLGVLKTSVAKIAINRKVKQSVMFFTRYFAHCC